MTPAYPLGAVVRWSLDPEHVQRILRTRVETAAGHTPVVQYLVHRTQDAPHHAYWAYAQELTLLLQETTP